MWDEAKARGIEIQDGGAFARPGVPIVKTVATIRRGLEKIKENLTSKGSSESSPYPSQIEAALSRITPFSEVLFKTLPGPHAIVGDESLTNGLIKTFRGAYRPHRDHSTGDARLFCRSDWISYQSGPVEEVR